MKVRGGKTYRGRLLSTNRRASSGSLGTELMAPADFVPISYNCSCLFLGTVGNMEITAQGATLGVAALESAQKTPSRFRRSSGRTKRCKCLYDSRRYGTLGWLLWHASACGGFSSTTALETAPRWLLNFFFPLFLIWNQRKTRFASFLNHRSSSILVGVHFHSLQTVPLIISSS